MTATLRPAEPRLAEPRPRGRKTPYAAPAWSARLYERMAQEHIALFKFLLEAHGHLGIMTVVDRHAAILKLSYSPDQEREMRQFLDEARRTVPFVVIQLPMSQEATMFDLEKAKAALAALQALLDATPANAQHVRVAQDAWTLAEIVGHLVDGASNNHQRWVRLRQGNLDFPVYAAEEWVTLQKYDECDFGKLACLWSCYNTFLLHLAATTPKEALENVWGGHPAGPKTLKALIDGHYEQTRMYLEQYAKRLEEVKAKLG